MARNRLAKKVVDRETGVVRIEFTDGTKVEVNVNELSEDVRALAAFHGISQKLGDSYAGADSVDEARESAEAVRDNLLAGNWTAGREGGGGGVSILVQALFEATQHEGRTLEDCQELVADMSDEQRKGLRQLPQIKANMDRIAAERAQKRYEKSRAAAGNKPLDLKSVLGE
jgi:hypothetical protein